MAALSRPLLPWLARSAAFRTLPGRLHRASEPRRADLIHVLGGGHASPLVRIDHGVRLLQGGWAPHLLLTGSTYGRDWARRNRERAVELGAPRTAVLVDSNPISTRGEAQALRMLATRKHLRSVILVTEAFHAGRAARIFEHALRGTGVRLISCPAEAESFPPPRWWESPVTRSLVLGELTRLMLARATGGA